MLGFEGHTYSITTTSLLQYSKKAAIGKTFSNGCECIPVRLYLQKLAMAEFDPLSIVS